ncbi:MAG: glycosyltransferase family 4 protein [Chloroflexota bacterium]
MPEIRHAPFSGPANHVREICFELMKLGHQVTVLANYHGDFWLSDDLVDFEQVASLDDKTFSENLISQLRRVQYKMKLPISHRLERQRFVLAIKKYLADCDVFYERAGWTGFGGGHAAQMLDIPLVLEVNGDHLSELEMLGMLPDERQLAVTKRLTQTAIGQATHIVSAGKGWKSKLLERWDYPETNITIVENGSQLVQILEQDELQAFTDQPHAHLNVVYIGAFHAWHGIDVGIKAFAQAVQDRPDMRLYLIGSGPMEPELRKLVDELAIEDKVDFLGHMKPEDMASVLNQCHVGLSPYCGRDEFSGLKLLDYKAAGLATIASGRDGNPEVIQNGETGCIVTPCDEDDLAHALVYLADKRDVCQKMGQKARQEAEDLHSWGYAAKQIDKILKMTVAL